MDERKRSLLLMMLFSSVVNSASCGKNQATPVDDKETLDLSRYEMKLVYKEDFSEPLSVVREEDLFRGETRVKKPRRVDWVLEGPGSAWTKNGRLHITNAPKDSRMDEAGHVVLWNTRTFPANFLLEFGFSPKNSEKGLAIIFFSATDRGGGAIFDLEQPKRGGIYKNYYKGTIDAYHVSYWAIKPNLEPRKKTHLRKSYGFHLVAEGEENIWNQGSGPHKVRLLKVDGKIQLETRGKVTLRWQDEGHVLGRGNIGLRTMAHTGKASYTSFMIWKIIASQSGLTYVQ